MQANNIFHPLLEDTLYTSARYLTENDIYHFLVKIRRIVTSNQQLDNDLSELFTDSNWRKVYSGCLALVIASRNQQEITRSIDAAWKNISLAWQDVMPVLGSLQLADTAFNQHLLEFINNGLPVTLYTPDIGNTLLSIQRQGTMAVIIEQLLKNNSDRFRDISELVNFAILENLKIYADPHANPMYHWKDKLVTLLEEIESTGEEALLAVIEENEIDYDNFLDL